MIDRTAVLRILDRAIADAEGADYYLNGARDRIAALPEQPAADAERLHPLTADLVSRFCSALAEKLADAERKYGYSDGWRAADWMDECRAKLMECVGKGDPLDVAAYCAFLWHHGEPTSHRDVVADAERYRWLRENVEVGASLRRGRDRWAIDLPDPGTELDADRVFDAAIDAAREAKR